MKRRSLLIYRAKGRFCAGGQFCSWLCIRFGILLCCLCPLHVFAAGVPYSVAIEGVDDPDIVMSVESVSQLFSLKKRPPSSIHALKFRADGDIPEIQKVLKAHGYYEAKVKVRIVEDSGSVKAIVTIYPGPIYTIESYHIKLFHETPENTIACSEVTLSRIGVRLGMPAFSERIINSELRILHLLAECGYPLASIKEQDMVVDGKTKTLRISLGIETGSLAHFGSVTIKGNAAVKDKFIEKKMGWKEGDQYDSRLVEHLQKELIDSSLFTSVLITHTDELDSEHNLPLSIEVTESKHKSINAGVSYQTFYGPGLTFGWENRNFGGMGRKFQLQGDLTKRSHSGVANYIIPDFWVRGQDYVCKAEAAHEAITPYSDRSYSLMNRIERKWDTRFRVSGGVKLERLFVKNSVQNGQFTLFELPIYFRWSTANSLLNPTRGGTLEYTGTPTVNFAEINEYYYTNEVIQSLYYSVMKHDILVLAHRFFVGSIFSNSIHSIPVPKRFLGGSEEDLRGYRYLAVSPLEGDKPIGGRAAIFYTFETRFRVSQTIGLVPFFDLGNVTLHQLPTLRGKWYKSLGLGLRYFSFLGPLRLDLAFPLDRRHNIDPVYRILVSIGQTF